ncbi:radical SAM/SPASM domain-containing protein [Stackebrandtia nassauensis]|uniref:Radical SAM domain protein n=1 Tax=Stackebrandtia nassauensis (strain DSM 44728 / CIP 108903 / NRRL B-16338 / NBRC 102104 / LLR-40K-21) TaxID=446470 RepID=D3Q7H7_STANL|nr:radical SAM protein [Stackebrandtia nassauensis]ADD44319.1 Radical SAM domain protein [Stackebrandtia nassauensis DSM 44728]
MTLHSARTGAIGVVPPDDVDAARTALKPRTETPGPLKGIHADLLKGGFLVPKGTNEAYLVNDSYQTRYLERGLHLIVMPTEQCNFRCVYCYESFKRGEMSPEVEASVRKLVDGQPDLDHLTLSWFGGEPLMAREVVFRLTDYLRASCARRGATFLCHATTNGYYLDPDYVDRVVPAGLQHFQITLDGVQEEHDKRRISADGEPTFDKIWGNLRYLRKSDHEFTASIRHNYDPDNFARFDEFIEMLRAEFAGDSRFAVELSPIGKWGGANDDNLNVCEGRDLVTSLFEAKRKLSAMGFRDSLAMSMMEPNGSTCYAANPRSFVIGPTAELYKCTVELDYHDRNVVGRLLPDGTLDLDWKKMALWTETDGMDEGKKCTTCYFRPSCHGAVCPKEWMDEPECGCPPVKLGIGQQLNLIRTESLFQKPVNAGPTCPRG